MSRSILLSTSFSAFIRKVLETVDPSTPYLHNWHIELMAEYLLACQRGEIKRLIINIPPRHLKSLIVSIAWPAWLLGHNPAEKIVCASYASSLAEKLSVDCRLVMESDWYKEAFPSTRLSADQNTKRKFVTTGMGFRMCTSVDSKVSTGLGGNYILIDDPISAQEQYSPVVREKANIWFDQVISSRLDNPNTGVIVIIMQRLHEDDLSGYLLNKGGWTHLKLSMIAEKDEVLTMGGKRYERKEGDLLHAERMGLEAINARKQESGAYSFAGQYQQNPSPEGGGALRKEWLQYYENIVLSTMNMYIFVDPADSKYKRSDYTAVMVIGIGQDNNYYIVDMIRDRLDLREREDMLFDLHKKYKPMGVHYEKHSMQSDIAHMKMAMEHRNYRFRIEPVTIQLAKDDRIGRLIPLFADGRIYLPRIKYKTNYENKEIDVVEAFVHEEYLVWNAGRHDDMLDALAMMCFVPMNSPSQSTVDISKMYQNVKW